MSLPEGYVDCRVCGTPSTDYVCLSCQPKRDAKGRFVAEPKMRRIEPPERFIFPSHAARKYEHLIGKEVIYIGTRFNFHHACMYDVVIAPDGAEYDVHPSYIPDVPDDQEYGQWEAAWKSIERWRADHQDDAS